MSPECVPSPHVIASIAPSRSDIDPRHKLFGTTREPSTDLLPHKKFLSSLAAPLVPLLLPTFYQRFIFVS